ncbi:DUF2264 domain-containing protein [Bailinhaonella thermotolerans]|uniref:DUF2264 domain-containing protein n=1 Tax=Bailinhaonella thermotolerans TaxID=1070861 RepID=A0A3A4AVQ1_9ACTN|nr:DUF2264 domain-containing protein [Bailinhaonella thermotolerans]RJL32791.1 DUF2264 domain-containing protein [Bailinhaonella thermotolerans]
MTPPYLALPPTDRVLSPRTGWTRAHWEAVADRLLDALVPHASPGFARVLPPGRGSWSGLVLDGLEGFARGFLLAAFRIAGAGGEVRPELLERYARGLASGTDPASGEAWPEITDCSQQMVEAAAIALALHETRPWIWDRLSPGVRERVVDWLAGFVGKRTWENNWMLFQTVTEEFLRSVGGPHEPAEITRGLDRIEEWYAGDGWYTDGPGRNFDYYNAWALHLYPLMWTRMSGDEGRAAVYRERLREFLGTYQHFFGADGAPIHHGRSLCYRFACLAPVWLGALCDATPLEPGRTRRLASGVLRHFAERGVPDRAGLLPLGWYGTFLPATQPYSGPASPYWAAKGFLGLLLPPGHAVWTAPELPLPIESGDVTAAIPAAGLLLHGTRHDGIARLVNHGSDHNPPPPAEAADDPHYAKLAYSSRTAPDASPDAFRRGVDNHLALLDGDAVSRRARVHPLACSGRQASSWHEVRLPGGEEARVESHSLVRGPWEVRVHYVTAPARVAVREGGHAVAAASAPETARGDGWALARRPDGLTSAVVGLYGWREAEVAAAVEANAFGPRSATPYLWSPGDPGVLVSLVVLSGDAVHPGALREAVGVDVQGDSVTVVFPDGDRATVTPAAR